MSEINLAIIAEALSAQRPLLHHLTPDSCWLIQLPRPISDRSERKWFNLLFDTWLSPTLQVDGSNWIYVTAQTQPPSCGSIKEVDELCRRVEELSGSKVDTSSAEHYLDGIVISHSNDDHCHPPTLLQSPSDIPVFAGPTAMRKLKDLNKFERIIEIPAYADDGGDTNSDDSQDLSPLPDWVRLGYIATTPTDLYINLALTFRPATSTTSNSDSIQIQTQTQTQSIIYSIHGMSSSLIPTSLRNSTLALLHPLNSSQAFWGRWFSRGIDIGRITRKELGAKYWLANHDAAVDSTTSGLFNYLVSFTRAQEGEVELAKREAEGDMARLEVVPNGSAMILA